MQERPYPDRGRHLVYWLATSRGELVYIGVTSNLPARIESHRRKWWWPVIDMAHAYFEEHETREAANTAEARDIWEHRPPANRVGLVLA